VGGCVCVCVCVCVYVCWGDMFVETYGVIAPMPFVFTYNIFPSFECRWPDIFRLKVRDKNFAIETPGETVYFKMVSSY